MQMLEARIPPRAKTQRQDLFTLRKNDWLAVCSVTCHVRGGDVTWELHLYVGAPETEILAASCESQKELFHLGEKWNAKMRANGWR